MKHEHLTGVPFQWGVDDCFTLTRRFFADNFDIPIRNYARPNDWEADAIDLLRVAYPREGFEIITSWKAQDIRPGDVLCFSIGEGNSNHLGIYLGDNKFLHHLFNRLSSVEEFRDFWLSRINYILRHPSVPDLRPVLPTTDIASLLRERYNLQAE